MNWLRRHSPKRIAALTILDAALAERAYLLGASFTFADLNVASTFSEPHENGINDRGVVDPLECGLKAPAGDFIVVSAQGPLDPQMPPKTAVA